MDRIVRCTTPDGLELAGATARPTNPATVGVLHLHGMYENFYLPRFHDHLADAVVDGGRRFVAANTRAHDYLVHCRRETDEGVEWSPQGGARERFVDCVPDVRGWVDHLLGGEGGIERVVLAGHSHGALKVTHCVVTGAVDDVNVAGTCLLSPSDDIGLQRRALGDRYDEALAVAGERDDDDLMPEWVFDNEITAGTYLDAFGPDSDLGRFRFDDPANGFSRFDRFESPMLVVFGEDDAATSTVDSERAIGQIRDAATNAASFTGHVVDGAAHDYAGREAELGGVVGEWLTTVA